jgi:predicted metal-binding membrane protein
VISVVQGPDRPGGLAAAFSASRAQVGLVAALLAAAGTGWWWTVHQMQGMDNGPWTSLGTLGQFIGIWAVMMAAMMLPSVAPTMALYSRMTRGRAPIAPLVFGAGYLVTWAAAGVVAFVLANIANWTGGHALAWDHAGRWVAGATLLVAAGYELTPLKDVCLGKCRSPLGFLLGSWREGWSGALRMGIENGAWCVGCCWALMASLFAIGIMSVGWMVVVAGLIAVEKLFPWRRVASYGVAAILLILGVLLLAAPDAVPNLTIPARNAMRTMPSLHSMPATRMIGN